MFTAGVRPASRVRATWASTFAQSIAPSAVEGRSTADIPVIARPGRNRGVTSSPTPVILARLRRYRAVVSGDDDDALMALLRLIASGDELGIARTLRDRPELASVQLRRRGATRQESEDHFLTELAHHVYRGDTALHVAAAAHRPPLVRHLVAGGATVDARNRRGATPLHYATDGGPGAPGWDPDAQADTVRALLVLGA